MVTRKNNVATKELNDNIDHSNAIIIWISLSLHLKWYIFRACIKEDVILTFLILGFIFVQIFGPKKDRLFCPPFVFHRVCLMSSGILCYICRVKT